MCPQFQQLRVGLQTLPCPWVLVLLLWRREAGFAPRLLLLLLGVPPRLPLLSPPPSSHTYARSHTLKHTLATLPLLLPPPLPLLCSVVPLPFDSSLTLTLHEPSMYILAVHTHRQPPPLLTLHLRYHGIRHQPHVANTFPTHAHTHTSTTARLISSRLSARECACAMDPRGEP